MANVTGNLFKEKLLKAGIDFSGDTFQAILMVSGFTFNRLTHEKYADVVASEMGTANGYSSGGVSLTGVAVTKVGASNKVTVTWNNPSWAVTPANLGPLSGMVVFDDTDTDDCIVLWIPFSPEQTQPTGGTFTVAGVEYDQVDTATAI
jgi:hypothetical protein